MKMREKTLLLLLGAIKMILADDIELPPCPTNVAYFPQTLPMHCKMFNNGGGAQGGGNQAQPTMPPSIFQTPENKGHQPLPFPVPPGFPPPMFPPAMPIPPVPMPIPMPGPPAQKLPVIVMPFYSPTPNRKDKTGTNKHRNKDKKKRKRPYQTDSESTSSSDEDESSEDSSDTDGSDGFWKPNKKIRRPKNYRRSGSRHRSSKRRHNKKKDKKELLTPMIQYMTKDGYVIFEKEISKNEAKVWLGKKSEEDERGVSYTELDKIKREQGDDDNQILDIHEPKYIKVKSVTKTEPEKSTVKPSNKRKFKATKPRRDIVKEIEDINL